MASDVSPSVATRERFARFAQTRDPALERSSWRRTSAWPECSPGGS